jgi:hypothetical protein
VRYVQVKFFVKSKHNILVLLAFVIEQLKNVQLSIFNDSGLIVILQEQEETMQRKISPILKLKEK